MKALQSGLKICLTAGLAYGLASALPVGVAQSQTVSIGALPQGSLSYAIAAAVAKVIGDKTDLTMRAIGVGGSNIYIPQVNQNKLQMSTSAAPDAIFAHSGTGSFDGRKNPDLRVLARLLEFQVGFMVKKSSKITALSGFKGQKFPSGYTSQKLVGTLVSAAFATEGMSFSDIKGVPVPNFVRGTDEMVAGRAVGSFLAPGSGVVRKAHAKVGIRFISMKADPSKLGTLQKIAPAAYFTTVKPSKRMPYITEPVKMIGFDYVILTNAKVSDAVAYKAAKALHTNKKALIAAHGVFRGFKPGLINKKGLKIAYHPGAAKYYKEAGLK